MSRTDDLLQALAGVNPAPVADDWLDTPASGAILDRIVSTHVVPPARRRVSRRALVVALAVITVVVLGASAQARVRTFVSHLIGTPSYYSGNGRPAPVSARSQMRAMFRLDHPEMTYDADATLGPIRKLASFSTTTGRYAYYVAPVNTSKGAAFCALTTGPGRPPGGGCSWQPLSKRFGVTVDSNPQTGAAIISGPVPIGIHEVALRLADGTLKPVPSGRGWFYDVVGMSAARRGPHAVRAVVGLSKSGKVITTAPVTGCFTGGTCAPATS